MESLKRIARSVYDMVLLALVIEIANKPNGKDITIAEIVIIALICSFKNYNKD